MIDRPTSGDQVRFQDWRLLKSDFIVVGKLDASKAIAYAAQFELFNVLTGQRLAGQQLTASADSMRAMSHRMADIIFEQLTGIRGALLHAHRVHCREGTPPKQTYKLLVADADGENQRVIANSTEPLMSPAWSPDGQSLAYVSFETKSSAIYVQTLRTGERRKVSARAGINGAPAWSPDGTTLAPHAVAQGRRCRHLHAQSRVADAHPHDVRSGDRHRSRRGHPTDASSISTPIAPAARKSTKVDVNNPNRAARVTFEGGYNARLAYRPTASCFPSSISIMAITGLRPSTWRRRQCRCSQGRQDESPSFAPNGATLIYATQDRGRGVLATVSIDAVAYNQTLGCDDRRCARAGVVAVSAVTRRVGCAWRPCMVAPRRLWQNFARFFLR